jgi:hypothetical protein
MAAKKGQRVSTQSQVGFFDTPQQISVSTSSAASAEITSEGIRVLCATAVFINYGDSSVTATTATSGYKIYLPANTTYDLKIGSNTHIAAITATGTDTLYLSEIQ